jgi:hypothetical protein
MSAGIRTLPPSPEVLPARIQYERRERLLVILTGVAMRFVQVSQQTFYELVGDEAVLLDLGSEHYFHLNPVATRAWQLIDATGDLVEVRAGLEREFDVAPDQLAEDLRELVDDLIAWGLLHTAERRA